MFRFILPNTEYIFRSGQRREYVSCGNILVFGQDTLGAAMSTVVYEVVGVPSRTSRTHLDEPRPNILRRTMDRDGMADRTNRVWNQFISRKILGAFGSRSFDLHTGVRRQYSYHYDECCRNDSNLLSPRHLRNRLTRVEAAVQ